MVTPNKSVPRRSNYVPLFHLERFADSRSHLGAFHGLFLKTMEFYLFAALRF